MDSQLGFYCYIIFHWNKLMSCCSYSRKWSERFKEECLTSPYSFSNYCPRCELATHKSFRGRLDQSSTSHTYRNFAKSMSRNYGDDMSKTMDSVKNSLSRLSYMKSKTAESTMGSLKKKGKENFKKRVEDQDQQREEQRPVVTKIVHVLHTTYVPAPTTQILRHIPIIQNIIPAVSIIRPYSAPKMSISYSSPIYYQSRPIPQNLFNPTLSVIR